VRHFLSNYFDLLLTFVFSPWDFYSLGHSKDNDEDKDGDDDDDDIYKQRSLK